MTSTKGTMTCLPLWPKERYITVLREAFKNVKMTLRLGVPLLPTFHYLVLVSPNARVIRPDKFDTNKVIKADAFKATIDQNIDSMCILSSTAKMIDEGSLNNWAEAHQPLRLPSETVGTAIQIEPPMGSAPLQKRLKDERVDLFRHCLAQGLSPVQIRLANAVPNVQGQSSWTIWVLRQVLNMRGKHIDEVGLRHCRSRTAHTKEWPEVFPRVRRVHDLRPLFVNQPM